MADSKQDKNKLGIGWMSPGPRPWTTGLWLVDPVNARVLLGGRDAPICELIWPTEIRSEAETFANGRLIEAAPDLFEALAQFEPHFEIFAHFAGSTGEDNPNRLVMEARAALRKALDPSK